MVASESEVMKPEGLYRRLGETRIVRSRTCLGGHQEDYIADIDQEISELSSWTMYVMLHNKFDHPLKPGYLHDYNVRRSGSRSLSNISSSGQRLTSEIPQSLCLCRNRISMHRKPLMIVCKNTVECHTG